MAPRSHCVAIYGPRADWATADRLQRVVPVKEEDSWQGPWHCGEGSAEAAHRFKSKPRRSRISRRERRAASAGRRQSNRGRRCFGQGLGGIPH